MSADLLRRAAALMRERARSARAGTWVADGQVVTADWEHAPRAVVFCDGSPIREGNVANAAHIASWHPAVAMAAADVLDSFADTVDVFGDDLNDLREIVAFARAYLGEQS